MSQSRATQNPANANIAAGREVSVPPPDGTRSEVSLPRETGGPAGPEPTRYGDWERAGRCIDF